MTFDEFMECPASTKTSTSSLVANSLRAYHRTEKLDAAKLERSCRSKVLRESISEQVISDTKDEEIGSSVHALRSTPFAGFRWHSDNVAVRFP